MVPAGLGNTMPDPLQLPTINDLYWPPVGAAVRRLDLPAIQAPRFF